MYVAPTVKTLFQIINGTFNPTPAPISSIPFNLLNTELTFYLLMWRIWWAPNNTSKGQMGFNSAFKGLNLICYLLALLGAHPIFHISRIRVNIILAKICMLYRYESSFFRIQGCIATYIVGRIMIQIYFIYGP